MAKTTQITVPLTSLSVGAHGPFTSALLPPALTGYILDFQNDASWPITGGDALTITVEQSNDGGSNWQFDASITMTADAWKNKAGTVVHTSAWSVSLDNQGSATRKVRVSLNVLQACTLGATVSSV